MEISATLNNVRLKYRDWWGQLLAATGHEGVEAYLASMPPEDASTAVKTRHRFTFPLFGAVLVILLILKRSRKA